MSHNLGVRRVFEYLWDTEPVNSDLVNEIVCLGESYDPRKRVDENGTDGDGLVDKVTDDATPPSSLPPSPTINTEWPPDFLSDVGSKLWLTYRTGFPLIPRSKDGPSAVRLSGILRGGGIDPSGFTSDVGWGCMIRTGQSLLANALTLLELGRDWRADPDSIEPRELQIAQLFRDDPSAAFSIHNFVRHGEDMCGKKPGEWFGPSAAASSIKFAPEKLRVYSNNGSDVYEDRFLRIANGKGNVKSFKPTLILLGIRAGIENVNPIYWDSVRGFLKCKQAVGIAGGRPSASHYFFAYQGDNLFYLDPHKAQPCLKVDEDGGLDGESYQTIHSRRIRLLHLKEMDPSMLVGFLIRDEDDWQDWKKFIRESKCNKIISISANESRILRRSSVSESQDDGGFIDVGYLEEGDEGDVDEDEEEDEIGEVVALERNDGDNITEEDVDELDDDQFGDAKRQDEVNDAPVIVESINENIINSHYKVVHNDGLEHDSDSDNDDNDRPDSDDSDDSNLYASISSPHIKESYETPNIPQHVEDSYELPVMVSDQSSIPGCFEEDGPPVNVSRSMSYSATEEEWEDMNPTLPSTNAIDDVSLALKNSIL